MIEPFRCGHVAIVGRTNAGKSTLVNRLVGEKISIVSPTPQTTRNLIIGVLNEPSCQVILVDTPGFHVPEHELNRRMVADAQASMGGVDAIVQVIDASDRVGRGDDFVAQRVRAAETPFVVALNKVDEVRPKQKLLPLMERFADGAVAVVPISARDGEGIAALLDVVRGLLPESPAIYPRDITTDQTERFQVAELIREKILLATREEIPHATAVLVERIEEKARDAQRGPLLVVEAVLAVEKENQKAILIGRGGAMLQRIGTAARLDIEEQIDMRCHLALVVSVLPRWREDRGVLERLFAGTRALMTAADVEKGHDDDEDRPRRSGEDE